MDTFQLLCRFIGDVITKAKSEQQWFLQNGTLIQISVAAPEHRWRLTALLRGQWVQGRCQ